MPTLLVIDDSQVMREAVQYAGGHFSVTIVLAESSEAALQRDDLHLMDGALVDIVMPGMDGIEACLELRSRAKKAGRDLPVWLVTGNAKPEFRRRAEEAGALKLIEKPFDFGSVIAELSSFIRSPNVTRK